MGDDRRPTYIEWVDGEEVRVWRASSLGACDRSLVMHALEHDGAATPEAVQKAYDAGTDMEDTILDGLRGKTGGNRWRRLDEDECHHPYNAWVDAPGRPNIRQPRVEIDCGKWKGVRQVVRCHPDAIAVKTQKLIWDGGDAIGDTDDNGSRRVVDAKFLKPSTYGGTPEKVMVKSGFYRWQMSVEMHGTGLPGMLLIGWKDDEGGLTRIEMGMIDEAPYTLGQVRARVMKLARMVEKAEEDGLGGVECDWAMYPCPFYETHAGQKVHAGAGDDGWWEGLDEETQKSIAYWAGMVEQARSASRAKDDERKRHAKKLAEVIAQAGWVRGEDAEGSESRVCAGWRVTHVKEPAKPARSKMVEYKASEAFEYVKVSRIKGA